MCRVVAPGGRYFDWLRTDPATISCGTNISEIFEGAKNSIINLVIDGLATHYFELMWVLSSFASMIRAIELWIFNRKP